jgi:integrase
MSALVMLDAKSHRVGRRGADPGVQLAKEAGLGEAWTPRELRHTFASLLSANDVNLEDIARLVGHSGTIVTERIYRHKIRPSLTQGAESWTSSFGNNSLTEGRIDPCRAFFRVEDT